MNVTGTAWTASGLQMKQNLNVEMRPEFAQALQNCMSFSSNAFLIGDYHLVENGRASLLMKTSSKRKRTKAELEEVKNEEEAMQNDT